MSRVCMWRNSSVSWGMVLESRISVSRLSVNRLKWSLRDSSWEKTMRVVVRKWKMPWCDSELWLLEWLLVLVLW